MAYANIPGAPVVPIGPGQGVDAGAAPTKANFTVDAANEAIIMIGQVVTSDGASHTIDTSGSSSIGWRSSSVTFANAGTTVKVGIAPVDAANGAPGRASNASDVISFDVSASLVGGGGGISANAWQTSVPTSGTKTIANGDLVAVAIQMTARGGVDSVQISSPQVSGSFNRPSVTTFTSSYASTTHLPSALITFADGAYGYLMFSDISSTVSTRAYNSGSSPNEYGQLYQFPFPVKIIGLYAWAAISATADTDFVLYSDPLGTPSAQKTASVDGNTVAISSGRRIQVMFSSPYSLAASTPIGAVMKPGANNVTAYYKTLAHADHRVADPFGTSGYGISRAGGSFSNANSSLDHYYIGLLCSAFDDGTSTGGTTVVGVIG